MSKNVKIAIDGPAGSGKSTTARLLASKLKYIYIDTGAMYRAITLWWLKNGKISEEKLSSSLKKISVELDYLNDMQITILNGQNVSDEIRDNEVSSNVSYISSLIAVREYLVEVQRNLARDIGVVMDGRDIGTVVFPNAELKIYLVADIKERAIRRQKELREKGQIIELSELEKEIALRDKKDSSRKISPLKKADDAIEIDTSGLSIEQQVEKIYDLAINII